MGYPTTVEYKGEVYETELDYQYNYLYGMCEIDATTVLDDLGIEYDYEKDADDINELTVSQDIPEDERLIDPLDEIIMKG